MNASMGQRSLRIYASGHEARMAVRRAEHRPLRLVGGDVRDPATAEVRLERRLVVVRADHDEHPDDTRGL